MAISSSLSFLTTTICIFIAIFLAVVKAHSKIEVPQSEAWYECADVPTADADEPYNHCSGPCATFLGQDGFQRRNTPESPAETWKRGETRLIEWTKNNHFGGFIRFALVPVSKKMDKSAHEYYAFEYGCWTSGRRRCTGKNRDCGTDRAGFKYTRNITVPSCYPDGVYVFGVVWFGGLENECCGARGDYWSCSHIRIKGGAPLEDSCQSKFVPGDDKKSCIANGNRTGLKPRKDRSRRIPYVFEDGKKPKKILAKKIIKDNKARGDTDEDGEEKQNEENDTEGDQDGDGEDGKNKTGKHGNCS